MAEEEPGQSEQSPKSNRHIITPEERRRGIAARTKTLLDKDPDHFKKMGKKGGTKTKELHDNAQNWGRIGGETTRDTHPEQFSEMGKKGGTISRPPKKRT